MHDVHSCEAPICNASGSYLETALWVPGEPICGAKPYLQYQRRQAKINRLVEKGKWKYTNHCYKKGMIESWKSVSTAKRGLDPNA